MKYYEDGESYPIENRMHAKRKSRWIEKCRFCHKKRLCNKYGRCEECETHFRAHTYTRICL